MVSATNFDFLSNLNDSLLVIIISLLPFKESVRTSVLSKRWKNLCHETTSIVFKESEFLTLSVFDREIFETTNLHRRLFVQVMRGWISRFTGRVIENFEIHLSQPMGFEKDILSLIEFATSRHVKNLVLDFSDPIERNLTQTKKAVRDGLLRCIYPQKNELDVSHLFFNLLYVKTLTICSVFLQVNFFPLF